LPCEESQEDRLALQKGGPVLVGEHASGCVHLQVLAVGFEPDVAFLQFVVELEGIHRTSSSRSGFLSAAYGVEVSAERICSSRVGVSTYPALR
jgi:hypothetical protein